MFLVDKDNLSEAKLLLEEEILLQHFGDHLEKKSHFVETSFSWRDEFIEVLRPYGNKLLRSIENDRIKQVIINAGFVYVGNRDKIIPQRLMPTRKDLAQIASSPAMMGVFAFTTNIFTGNLLGLVVIGIMLWMVFIWKPDTT